MQKKVLFTNYIKNHHQDNLSDFDIKEIPFIEIKKKSIDYELDIETEYPVIVTSKNAVWAVDELKLVNNPMYVVGNSTAKKLANKGYTIEAVAEDSFSLVDKLPERDAYYLCGNLRRDTIGDFYKDKDYTLYEVEVYETSLSPHKIDEYFDAIVFLSPSAVKSYFELNSILNETKIFAIGNTTSLEISNYTEKKYF